MKSFNQFLNECYLSEEEVQGRLLTNRGTAQNFRNPKRIPFTGTDPTPTPASRRLPAGSPEGPRTSPGQMEIPEPKTTKVPGSKVRGEPGQGGSMVKAQEPGKLARSTGSNPGIPDAMLRGAQDAANKPPATPKPPASTPTKPSSSVGKPPTLSSTNARRASAEAKKAAAAAGTGSSGKTIVTPAPSSGGKSGGKPPTGSSGASSAAKEAEKVVTKTATKSVAKGILRAAGKIAGPASAALDVADERSKGSGWARSLAKGAVVAAGGALGGAGGSVAGPVGTVGGAVGGSMAASKAFDVAAGANAKERKAIATANRQGQSGGAIKGVGGPTSFDTKKNTITSGGKTAQLGKTSVVTNPKTGKQEVGNLAYKNGQAVYKRSDTKSLAQTSSNPLERIGRSLFAGAYKQSDAANAAKKLNQARQSDTARNKALGVKMLPGK
jgi:hypothetical protein